MKERQLSKLSKEMTVGQRVATCVQLWAADRVDEGRRILADAPAEQREQINSSWERMRRATRLCVIAGRPIMRAVIEDILHLQTIRMAGCLGLETRIALDRMALMGDLAMDLNEPQEDEILRRALESAWTFQRAGGLAGAPGIAEVAVADEPDFDDRGDFRKLWLVTILDKARGDYRGLRAVQIALNSLAASLGVSSLDGVVVPGFEQEVQDNLADLRRMLEGMLPEEQLVELEPSDEEVRELLAAVT